MEAKKSTFITVLSWMLIIVSGLGVFVSIMQNIMINTIMPMSEIQEAIKKDPSPDKFLNFLAFNIRYVFLLFGFFILGFFISSIALLKRKNWARIVMIAVFAIGIVYSIGAGIFQGFFMNRMVGFDDEFDTMRTMMFIFTFVFVIGFIVLYSWVIKKLTSTEIKEEFIKNNNLTQQITQQ